MARRGRAKPNETVIRRDIADGFHRRLSALKWKQVITEEEY